MTAPAGPLRARNFWELLDGRGIEWLAKRSGIPRSTVSNIFAGRVFRLSLRRGLDLARALRCKPEEVLQAHDRAREIYIAKQRALGLIGAAAGRGYGRAGHQDARGRFTS